MQTEHISCLIIGSGPAGYTAAIYAARAGLKPVMYTGIQPGGQLMITNDVENFPGYPEGVMGPKMMEDLRLQAVRFGTDVRYMMISETQLGQSPKWVKTDDGKELTADTVIIATGASAKWLGIPSEERLNGFGVSACAVCDGYFFRQQEVAIVGAGDTAAEEATYLAKLCKTVHMIVRRDVMRASKVMQDRVLNTPNIKVYWNSETEEILGEKAVEGVRIINTQTQEKTIIPITGFFVAIGHQPNTDIFKGQLKMEDTGYIITEGKSTKTNLPGVFACGDAQDAIYRQAVTAAGTGCMAALDAERWLSEQGLV
jgi:thioredoxin reductase (NADPH)